MASNKDLLLNHALARKQLQYFTVVSLSKYLSTFADYGKNLETTKSEYVILVEILNNVNFFYQAGYTFKLPGLVTCSFNEDRRVNNVTIFIIVSRNYGRIIDHCKYEALKRLIHKLNITKVDFFPFKSGIYRTAQIGRVTIHLIGSWITEEITNSNTHLLIPRIRDGVEVVIPYPFKTQQKTESLQSLCLKKILFRNL